MSSYSSGAKLTGPERLALAAILLLLGGFLLYPLGYSLANGVGYVGGVFRNRAFAEAIANSLRIAAFSTAIAFAVGFSAAWAFHTFDFPGKAIFQNLLFIPLVLPPFVGAIGMKFLFSQFGSVNLLLMQCGVIEAPIDWFGDGGFLGVVALEALHLYPIMFLNVLAAFSLTDPSLEEAARSLGARGFSLFRTVTLPLVLPGVFAGVSIVFIWAFTDLGVPLIFNYRQVVTVQIFNMTRELHENPMGYSLLTVVLALSMLMYFGIKLVLGRSGQAGAGPGRHERTGRRPKPLGLAAIYILMTALAVVSALPHIGVALVSFADQWSVSILPDAFTLKHFETVFSHDLTTNSVKNSLGLSFIAAIIDMALGFAIAWVLVRRVFAGKALVDGLAMLPLAIPGLVLAFGYVGAFAGTPLDPFVNPFPLLIAAYAIRRLPLMVRALAAGLQQLGSGLEEASFNLGAGPLATWRFVTLPLLRAGLTGGGLLAFAFAMLEVSDSLILAMEDMYYPVTKAIYQLTLRFGDGPYVASALGTLGMLLLMGCFLLAAKAMGRRMGEMFRM